MSQTIHITLSDTVAERLKRQASTANQTLAEFIADYVSNQLPDVLQARLEALEDYSVEQLMAVVRQTLSDEQKARYEFLSDSMEFEMLSHAEKQELDDLVKLIENLMVLRSRALALLIDQGIDIQPL